MEVGRTSPLLPTVGRAHKLKLMKVVVLVAHTPDGEPQHRYVAHELVRAFPDEIRAIIVATGRRKNVTERIRGLLRRYSAGQIVSRVALAVRHRLNGHRARRHAIFDALFFPAGGGKVWPRADLVQHVPLHNSTMCKMMLDELRPDIIVTYGTLIIRPDVIERARISMINMHTGLSPTYRGSDTVFWPLHNGEPDLVGVTVHRVDPGVDSGAILHTAKPIIAASDNEHQLFAKCVIAGTAMLIRAVREEFEQRSVPQIQDLSAGHEYRSVQRTVTAERRVERLLRQGLLRDAALHGANVHV